MKLSKRFRINEVSNILSISCYPEFSDKLPVQASE